MIYSTTGSEFISISTKKEYVGYYHYFQGQPYAGVDDAGPETRLDDFQFGVEAINFKKLKPRFGQHLNDPQSFRPTPSQKEYANSTITRYFVKNLHTGNIHEVSDPTYKNYKKETITLKTLYSAIKLVWKISGPQNDVVTSDGTILKTGIIETNQKTMALHKYLFPELPLVLPADDLAKITS
tara:strand:+ start:71 stop:616 length:546 start_codon:yes stop_codon:yes gene_type:complete